MTGCPVAPVRPDCCLLAEAAGDPRAGTAPPAQRWLLIGHPIQTMTWGRTGRVRDCCTPVTIVPDRTWPATGIGRFDRSLPRSARSEVAATKTSLTRITTASLATVKILNGRPKKAGSKSPGQFGGNEGVGPEQSGQEGHQVQ